MNLSPRLRSIAKLVKADSIVGDIGTDHGYIPVYLVENKIANKVIASDVNEGPLENANKTISLYKLQNCIETRLGNGLETIKPNEIDTVIIAGMGGELISEILGNNREVTDTITNFILQPMSEQASLRKWLEQNGFVITYERLAKEGEKIYEIIVANKGTMVIDDPIHYEIGYKLIEKKDPILKEFIERIIGKYTNILDNVKNINSNRAVNKKNECINKIDKLKELKKCL